MINGIIFGKQGGEEERLVAKSRFARNLVSKTLSRSPTALSSNPSQRLVNPTANCSTLDLSSTGNVVAMDSKKNNASNSQGWHTDTDPNSSTGKTCCEIEQLPLVQVCFMTFWPDFQAMSCVWRKSARAYERNWVRPKENQMQQVNTNAIIQELFMAASMKAAVHVGKLGRYCTCHEEHSIRRGSAFVLHHAEIDS